MKRKADRKASFSHPLHSLSLISSHFYLNFVSFIMDIVSCMLLLFRCLLVFSDEIKPQLRTTNGSVV
jgi:hypothetical protein